MVISFIQRPPYSFAKSSLIFAFFFLSFLSLQRGNCGEKGEPSELPTATRSLIKRLSVVRGIERCPMKTPIDFVQLLYKQSNRHPAFLSPQTALQRRRQKVLGPRERRFLQPLQGVAIVLSALQSASHGKLLPGQPSNMPPLQ